MQPAGNLSSLQDEGIKRLREDLRSLFIRNLRDYTPYTLPLLLRKAGEDIVQNKTIKVLICPEHILRQLQW